MNKENQNYKIEMAFQGMYYSSDKKDYIKTRQKY